VVSSIVSLMPDLTRRQCSVARMRGNRRGCAARGRLWRRRAGALAAARARTRRNAGRRERAHCALARTNLRIVPMKTGRLALGGPRLNLCAVECGAAPVRRWVHKARSTPPRAHQLAQHLHQRPPMRPPSPAARAAAPARTAPPTTSVLPCVLRRSAGGLTDRSTRIASPAARHATLISCTHPR
jgi:hypothetical protein